jgi:hypothetical protein
LLSIRVFGLENAKIRKHKDKKMSDFSSYFKKMKSQYEDNISNMQINAIWIYLPTKFKWLIPKLSWQC